MIHFLSGLPRSGSTVLAAILNQHPQVYASPTSPLVDLLGNTVMGWERNPAITAQGRDKQDLYLLLRSLIDAKYSGIAKPVILDKSRGWPAPQIMTTMAEVLGHAPKIIATVRDPADCAASFVRVAKPADIKSFLRESPMIAHLKSSYVTLREGYKANPENFCIVEYDDLLADPKTQLDRIHAFLGLEPFAYDFDAIDGSTVAEHDKEAWNLDGLHDIKPKLQRQHDQDSRTVLGMLYEGFCQPAFWRVESEKPKHLIDLQLEAAKRGDFGAGWNIAQQLEKERPDDDRAAFNRGWYVIREGRLRDGLALMDRGRAENVFGNRPVTGAPMWDGRTAGDVLLTLEGGLGDQIHQVRFAHDIALRGSRAIVVASPEMIPLLRSAPGVSALCTRPAAQGIYHDYQVLGMSAPVPLGLEHEDIRGTPYLSAQALPRTDSRFRIGLRWQGYDSRDHELGRRFDPQLLFDAVKDIDADFVSLQRDDGVEHRPDWVAKVPLDDWQTTANVVAGCDLVITSCTSIAHLGGALGIPTWVMVPIMPYFLWAVPGDTACWYDSVKLFRQEAYQDWTGAFDKLRAALGEFNRVECAAA